MLQRNHLILNRARAISSTKCVRIGRFGLKTSAKNWESGKIDLEKSLTADVAKTGKSGGDNSFAKSNHSLDHSITQKSAVKILLDVAGLFSRPSNGQDFRQTIADYKQIVARSGVLLDESVLESAINMAAMGNQSILIPRILRASWWLDLNSSPKIYESICDSLFKSRKWNALIAVLRFCTVRHIGPTSKLLNMRLRTYLYMKDYSMLQLVSAKRIFSKFGCSFNRETYNILIEASVANLEMETCRQTIVQMESEGFPINEETYRAILARMVAMGPNRTLESTIFTSLQGIDATLDTAILNSLIRLRSIARDDVTLRQYISFLQQGGTHSADSQQLHIPFLDTQPDISTIAVLIGHFTRRQQFHSALEAFNLIHHLKLELSAEVVAQVVSMYSSCGRIQDALALVANISTTLPVVRFERANKLLQQLGWDGTNSSTDISDIPADVDIFNAILKTVIAERGLDGMVTILDLMEVHYIAPNDDMAAIFISFLDRHKNTNSTSIIIILYRLSQYPSVWRQRHVNVIMHSIMREHKRLMFGPGGWKGASAFSNPNRERKSPKRISSTYERASDIFSIMNGAKLPEQASNRHLRSILVAVNDSAARQDSTTYSIRMFYHARITRDAGAVEDLYRDMLNSNLQPNVYHVAALMEVYCNIDQVETALEVLSTAVSNGIGINRVHYTILIRAFGNRGDTDSVHRVYREMIHSGVQPDIAALDAVVRSHFLVQDYDGARAILFQLWGTVLPLDTLPPSTSTLSYAMSFLRSQEKAQRHAHAKFASKDAANVKEIVVKWRRASKRRKSDAKSASHRLASFKVKEEEVSSNGLSSDNLDH